MLPYLEVAVGAYLLGSIPFGYLLVRAFRGHDIRESGSGNIGATNVARSSPVLGFLTLAMDAGKGWLAVWWSWFVIPDYFKWLPTDSFPSEWLVYPALAAVFVVLGHVFPVWLKFHGGKGVATGVGAFYFLAPAPMMAAVLVFLVLVALFRRVSLGSIVATTAFPMLAYAMRSYQSSEAVLISMAATALLIVARHHDNLRRLFAGTEPRFEWRRT